MTQEKTKRYEHFTKLHLKEMKDREKKIRKLTKSYRRLRVDFAGFVPDSNPALVEILANFNRNKAQTYMLGLIRQIDDIVNEIADKCNLKYFGSIKDMPVVSEATQYAMRSIQAFNDHTLIFERKSKDCSVLIFFHFQYTTEENGAYKPRFVIGYIPKCNDTYTGDYIRYDRFARYMGDIMIRDYKHDQYNGAVHVDAHHSDGQCRRQYNAEDRCDGFYNKALIAYIGKVADEAVSKHDVHDLFTNKHFHVPKTDEKKLEEELNK